MFGKRILNIAHRGLETRVPENTIAAFEAAMNEGADGFELDVQLTKDGEVSVIHDLTVDRTTDGLGKVKDKTLQELKRLDAGLWFNPLFMGEQIPTLEEVLDKLPKSAVLDIELKDSGISPRLPKKVADIIKKRNVVHRVIVASYNPLALWYAKRFCPEIKTKMIGLYEKPNPCEIPLNRLLIFLLRKIRRLILWFLRPTVIDTHHDGDLTQQLAALFKRNGYRVAASVLEKRADMEKVLKFDIDIIINRDPRLLKNILDGKP